MDEPTESSNTDDIGSHFCEKLFHYAEDPSALNDFSDQDVLMLLQFLIYGSFLNEKQELYFELGPQLTKYIKNFTLDESSLEEARYYLFYLREDDGAEVDLTQSVSNFVNDIIIRYLKQ